MTTPASWEVKERGVWGGEEQGKTPQRVETERAGGDSPLGVRDGAAADDDDDAHEKKKDGERRVLRVTTTTTTIFFAFSLCNTAPEKWGEKDDGHGAGTHPRIPHAQGFRIHTDSGHGKLATNREKSHTGTARARINTFFHLRFSRVAVPILLLPPK
uniref:(northern house mosquito) hypothetical protein n=1 Tax=Culex pipiens TaxID=7175 RepID=A0A8D8IM82_CULPI